MAWEGKRVFRMALPVNLKCGFDGSFGLILKRQSSGFDSSSQRAITCVKLHAEM